MSLKGWISNPILSSYTYTEVRSLMVEKYDRNDFGPVITTEIRYDVSTEELQSWS